MWHDGLLKLRKRIGVGHYYTIPANCA
jgi:hypothetical protein